MAEHDLKRLERVGMMRRQADEMRLARTRRSLGEAMMLRESAEERSEAEARMERALIRQCYEKPGSEQAWIARAHQAQLANKSEQEAEARRAEESELAARKAAEAKAILRDDARLGAVRSWLTQARIAAVRSEEEAAAEERQDSQCGQTKP
ncbi:hypothetical protein [Qipengyuania qiaonensis]|uniref:Uncharacterized protein n=1 Tax=Qipengyuania qiaonensis TaxID=2867240 RepID=A0ABS7J732_9SPHN|nr:hypothetical protein [Qipengyuania qiaonensis]MBX7482748.1 hypothetical protein [Qipengyuania qiaonensis]